MSKPPLNQLPPPPPGKTGWPWIVDAPRAHCPASSGSNSDGPRISIVTPSFNQGAYLEETLRSVLLQDYPNLEYIVMDGGSTDESRSIIEKYRPWLDYAVSEKDKGQADAIYRGFERSTGEVIGWINSDDYFLPDALKRLATHFENRGVELISAGCVCVDEKSRLLRTRVGLPRYYVGYKHTPLKNLVWGCGFNQPGTLWKRDAFFATGGFERSLYFAFDYDMFVRFALRRKSLALGEVVACFRQHQMSKSTRSEEIGRRETAMLAERHGVNRYPLWLRKLTRVYFRETERAAQVVEKARYLLSLRQIPLPELIAPRRGR